MRSALASALLTALALVAIPALPASVQASTGVVRCQMPDGSTAYSNKPCGSFGATSAPISGALHARIASETRHEARLRGDTQMLDALAATPQAASRTPTRREVAAGCAANPRQLLGDLQASIALGDVNRLAESYHWVGMSQAQARTMMQRLEQLARRPLVSAQYFDAGIGAGALFADASAAAGGEAGLLQLASQAGEGSGRSITDFGVVRYQGCYFVRY